MTAHQCPDKETLFGYVVGTITEDVAEAVAEHLLACRPCEQTVEALEGLSDTVVSALRQSAPGDPYAEEPACRQVRQQMQALREGGPDIANPQVTATPSAQRSRRTSRLGDYELLKKLGEGGMGTVYQAQHVRLKRIVALKVLPKNRLGNTEAIARFEREVEAVGRLDHPNIVRAMDAREVDGIRFLVMEHVDGLDLAEVVERCGPLSVADACEATRQAALGLQCSEEHRLVHRDIKPSNLMLSSEGRIKVLDLGLAQFQEAETLDGAVTGVGQVMGTPDYISPEQALESHTVDIRTDIYSLGCTLYYLLAGKPPFSGSTYDTPMKKLTGHIRDAVPPIEAARPDLPRSIVALLARMLAKTPSQRVAQPADVVNSLAPFCKGSKLIGLLREARTKEKKAEAEQSHRETEGLQVSALVDTSRDNLTPVTAPAEPAAVAAAFDPYHRWLGIAPDEQPADHYRLLGMKRFESDSEVIRDAAARQMAHVRTYHLGPHSELSQKILNELGMAKACLMDPQKKAAYDAKLQTTQPSQVIEAPTSLGSPSVGDQFAPLVVNPDWEVGAPLATTRRRRRAAQPRLSWLSLRQLAKQVVPWLRTPVGIAMVAAGFLTVAFAGFVIRVQTNYGTVKIEIPEGVANISVKLDGDTISIDGLGDPLQLRPGAHELVVTGKDYKTNRTSFTVRRGEQELVRVTLEPKAENRVSAPPRLTGKEGTVLQKPATVNGAKEREPAGILTNSIGMAFKLIPPGEFLMGSTQEEVDRLLAEAKQRNEPQWLIDHLPLESPQHRVRLTKPFYLGIYEVTQEQYQRVMGTNPSSVKGPQYPVDVVTWDDAEKFCKVLSALPEETAAGRTYRLPTEAEWEYACRAGSTTRYAYGDDEGALGDYAWFSDNSSSTMHRVGEKRPNAWGLYDMHGNVVEWCADRYGKYTNTPVDDPLGPATREDRVIRGGSWNVPALACRGKGCRGLTAPLTRYFIGFRVAAVPSRK